MYKWIFLIIVSVVYSVNSKPFYGNLNVPGYSNPYHGLPYGVMPYYQQFQSPSRNPYDAPYKGHLMPDIVDEDKLPEYLLKLKQAPNQNMKNVNTVQTFPFKKTYTSTYTETKPFRAEIIRSYDNGKLIETKRSQQFLEETTTSTPAEIKTESIETTTEQIEDYTDESVPPSIITWIKN